MRGAKAVLALAVAGALGFALASWTEPTADEERVEALIAAVQEDFAGRDFKAVCAALDRVGRRQVVTAGHGRLPSCAEGLRLLDRHIRARAERGQAPAPGPARVAGIEVRHTAIATLEVGRGMRGHVEAVEQAGEWKLGGLYGIAPTPSPTIR